MAAGFICFFCLVVSKKKIIKKLTDFNEIYEPIKGRMGGSCDVNFC